MERVTGTRAGLYVPDDLIAGTWPPTDSFVVELTTPGVLRRGTVLSMESDGRYEVLGSGSGKARAILADDTLEEDDTAVAYREGRFKRGKLIVAEEYEMTAADEDELRIGGIILVDAMGNAPAGEGVTAAGTLTVTSAAGTAEGTTKITVSPTLTEGDSYTYKVGDADEIVTDGQVLSDGWTAWNGTADITAATGKILIVAEIDSEGRAVRAGSAVVTAKTD